MSPDYSAIEYLMKPPFQTSLETRLVKIKLGLCYYTMYAYYSDDSSKELGSFIVKAMKCNQTSPQNTTPITRKYFSGCVSSNRGRHWNRKL